jgi:hypothetical protein
MMKFAGGALSVVQECPVRFRAIAPPARQPKIAQIIRAATRMWHDVLYLDPEIR